MSEYKTVNNEDGIYKNIKEIEDKSTSKCWQGLHDFFESRAFYLSSVVTTIMGIILASMVKILNSMSATNPNAFVGSLVCLSLYAIITIISVLEIFAAILVHGRKYFWDKGSMQFINIYDMLIVFGDIIVNIMVGVFFIFVFKGLETSQALPDYFGSLNTLRLLTYLMRDKRLSKIITGVKRSFGTIILAFTFLFTVLYSFALVGYSIWNPQDSPTCTQTSNF
jgi:hypothetical protein